MTLIEALFGLMSIGSSLGRIAIIGEAGPPPILTFYLLQEDGISRIILEDGTGLVELEH